MKDFVVARGNTKSQYCLSEFKKIEKELSKIMSQIDIRKHLAYLNEKYGVLMMSAMAITHSAACMSSAASCSRLWWEHIAIGRGNLGSILMANPASGVDGLSSGSTHRRGSTPITTPRTTGICSTAKRLSGHRNGMDIQLRM